jgi:hypothetical protein
MDASIDVKQEEVWTPSRTQEERYRGALGTRLVWTPFNDLFTQRSCAVHVCFVTCFVTLRYTRPVKRLRLKG